MCEMVIIRYLSFALRREGEGREKGRARAMFIVLSFSCTG